MRAGPMQQLGETQALSNPAGFFTGDVSDALTTGTPIISLAYCEPENPAHNLLAQLAPNFGSNLFRFRVGEHDLLFADQDLLTRGDFTGNLVLWPIPNRLREKQYVYRGQRYSFADISRPGGSASLIHGLVFDRAWSYEQPVIGATAASVTTWIEITSASPHYEAYPFPARLALTYRLSPCGLTITYEVQNTGREVLPFGFALHPFFTPLSGGDETYICLPANRLMVHDRRHLPTGECLDLSEPMYKMYDLRRARPLEHLHLDHVYTDLSLQARTTIEYRKQALNLHITATDDFTHAVVYTPSQAPFFCIEHQTCSSDALNLSQHPQHKDLAHLLEVSPGDIYTGTLNYTLEFVSHLSC